MMTSKNEPNETQQSEEPESPQPGPDEVFCTECGSVIKKRAEICPECGVRQKTGDESASQQSQQPQQPQQSVSDTGSNLSERRQYELEKIASKSNTAVILWGIFLTPVAYWKVGRKGLAILNFITFNYVLLGWIIVPIHCNKIINDAQEELRMAGVGGY